MPDEFAFDGGEFEGVRGVDGEDVLRCPVRCYGFDLVVEVDGSVG